MLPRAESATSPSRLAAAKRAVRPSARTETNPPAKRALTVAPASTENPSAVPVTSTFALTNATLPYVLALAEEGLIGAIEKLPGLRPGVNVAAGKVTHPAVAEGVGAEYTPVEEVLTVTA